jgi:hypothetical protein
VARVRRFVKDSPAASRAHPTEVDCGYAIISAGGRRYLQLNTYGSPSREIPGKVSQTLQLDQRAAAKLVSLLQEAFPAKRPP